MPAFCAAFGSFHPKSSVTYLVRVLTTVRVLPFFLTFTLICSSTLTVSTFGVRSYSDQRYWSMQTSGSGHASSTSELTAGLAAFCTGSVGLTAANGVGVVAGCGIGGGSDKAALPLPASTTTEPDASLASFRSASGCSTTRLLLVPPRAAASEEGRAKRRSHSRYRQRRHHARPVLLLGVRRRVRRGRSRMLPE